MSKRKIKYIMSPAFKLSEEMIYGGMRERKIGMWTWFVLCFFYVLICGLLAWYIVSFRKLSEQVDYLKANQNVMIWSMDSSCFNQIRGSMDGTLRLKISK